MKVKVKKPFPFYPYLLQEKQGLPDCNPISVGCPGDIRYTRPLPHPTNPNIINKVKSGKSRSVPTKEFGFPEAMQLGWLKDKDRL